MTEKTKNKQKNKKNSFSPCLEFETWNLRLGICDLFEIWCLEFVIYLKFGAWNL